MKILIAILFGACLQDEAKVASVDAGGPVWVVRGTCETSKDEAVAVSARRVERRWDDRAGKFVEVPSEAVLRRGAGQVSGKGFEARIKAGPPGIYAVVVAAGERKAGEARPWMGARKAFLAGHRDHLSKAEGLADQASAFVSEVERGLTKKAYGSFRQRLVKAEEGVRRIEETGDLTATVRLLKEVYFHLRNIQGLDSAEVSDEANNDSIDRTKASFLEEGVSLESLRGKAEGVRKVAALEVQVSIAQMLAGHGDDSRRLAEAAREALDLAGEKGEFRTLVEEAAQGKSEKLAPFLKAWIN